MSCSCLGYGYRPHGLNGTGSERSAGTVQRRHRRSPPPQSKILTSSIRFNTSGQGTLSLRALTQPFLKFVINLKSKFKPIRLPLNWLFLFQRLQQGHSCAEGTNVNNFHHVSYSYLRTHSGKDRKGAEGVRKIGGL